MFPTRRFHPFPSTIPPPRSWSRRIRPGPTSNRLQPPLPQLHHKLLRNFSDAPPRNKNSDWLGNWPTLPDYLPVLSRSSAKSNVIYAFGHQHIGFTLAGITGKIVADIATTTTGNCLTEETQRLSLGVNVVCKDSLNTIANGGEMKNVAHCYIYYRSHKNGCWKFSLAALFLVVRNFSRPAVVGVCVRVLERLSRLRSFEKNVCALLTHSSKRHFLQISSRKRTSKREEPRAPVVIMPVTGWLRGTVKAVPSGDTVLIVANAGPTVRFRSLFFHSLQRVFPFGRIISHRSHRRFWPSKQIGRDGDDVSFILSFTRAVRAFTLASKPPHRLSWYTLALLKLSSSSRSLFSNAH